MPRLRSQFLIAPRDPAAGASVLAGVAASAAGVGAEEALRNRADWHLPAVTRDEPWKASPPHRPGEPEPSTSGTCFMAAEASVLARPPTPEDPIVDRPSSPCRGPKRMRSTRAAFFPVRPSGHRGG